MGICSGGWIRKRIFTYSLIFISMITLYSTIDFNNSNSIQKLPCLCYNCNNKLNKIQSNDISKTKACLEAKIDLCIIDTSGQKYFKETSSEKYLHIISTVIKERLLTA
jgi:hypothetical protein